MGKPQKEPLRELTVTEQAALQRIVQASSERGDRVRRAPALLTVAGGGRFADAARTAGLRSGTSVAKLVAVASRPTMPRHGPRLSPPPSAHQIGRRTGRPPGRCRPSSSDYARMDLSRSVSTPSSASWRMRAVPTRRPGVGVHRGRHSESARAGWSPSWIRTPS